MTKQENKLKKDFTEDAQIIATKLLPEELVSKKKVYRRVVTAVKRMLSASNDLDDLLEELRLTYDEMEAKINEEIQRRLDEQNEQETS